MVNSRERERYEKLIRRVKNKAGVMYIEDLLEVKHSPREMIDDSIKQIKYEKNLDEVKLAISYLQAARVERSLDPLLERLENEQEIQIRCAIIQAIGYIKAQPKRVIPILEEILLNDSNDKVRRNVAQALGNFGEKSNKILLNALFRERGKVRYQIIEVLIEIEFDEAKLIKLFQKEVAVACTPYEKYSFASGLIMLEGLESNALKIINDLIESDNLTTKQISAFNAIYNSKNDEKNRQKQAQQKLREFIKKITATHETDKIEFKSTFTGASKNKNIVQESKFRIARVIASFMNSKGGFLFIGVNDDGMIIGLERDYKILKGDNKKDAFKQELAQTITKHLGAIYHHLIDVKFAKYFAYEICVIKVKTCNELVPLIDLKEQKHYVIRTINRTYSLKSHEIDKYNDIRTSKLSLLLQ